MWRDPYQLSESSFLPLPDAEQVSDYLQKHPLRMPSRGKAWLPLLILGGVLAVSFASDHVMAVFLPWMVLAAILLFFQVRIRRIRQRERDVLDAQELAMLRRHRASLRRAWRLLPQVVAVPAMYHRVVSLLAHCLDHLKAYDSAIVAYNDVVNDLPPQHPVSVQIRIRGAIALLQCDRLTDADEELRRLHHLDASARGTGIEAGYCLAQLIQQVRTNHFSDAVQSADTLLDDLRPLGVEAAFGHALMALSFHHSTEPDAGPSARLWWARATLLLPEADLVGWFADLKPLIEL